MQIEIHEKQTKRHQMIIEHIQQSQHVFHPPGIQFNNELSL